jgi:tetratricopeptide (TPR) repeat protein
MIRRLLSFVKNLFGPSAQEQNKKFASETKSAVEDAKIINEHVLAPSLDVNLFERARTQWQFGDWTSLIKIDQKSLESHPERAKLGLLVAAAHFQIGELNEARRLITLAQEWGCNRRILSQVLIAGVHNSLGRATALNGQLDRANLHFESAVRNVSPSSDIRLLTLARSYQQLDQLGIHPASDSIRNQVRSI